MRKSKYWLLLLIAGIFCLSGCAALVAGGAAVTAGTGTFFYIKGDLRTDYRFSFDEAWEACERVVADMNAIDIIPIKEIGKGTIDAVIKEEKAKITITYKSINLTTVGIRIGLVGNQRASQRLHDKITEYLMKK